MSNQEVAFIVGGSSGIGLATAKELVAQGIKTIILGSNASKVEQARKYIGNSPLVEILQANH